MSISARYFMGVCAYAHNKEEMLANWIWCFQNDNLWPRHKYRGFWGPLEHIRITGSSECISAYKQSTLQYAQCNNKIYISQPIHCSLKNHYQGFKTSICTITYFVNELYFHSQVDSIPPPPQKIFCFLLHCSHTLNMKTEPISQKLRLLHRFKTMDKSKRIPLTIV
jgi:hypothetical protein